MTNKTEAQIFADDRPSSLDDDLYQWSLDAEIMLRAQADRAYQLHHFRCRFCISAGMAPGKQPRCADGQKLWDAYRVACDPRAARKSIAEYIP